MKKYTTASLEKALDDLDIHAGENLYLHCGIHAFGIIEGNETRLFKDLHAFLGNDSTIVVPTFTLWLPEDEVYTADTPSQRMGRMSEYIRTLPGAVRSKCPMHNHAAIGPLSHLLTIPEGLHSTGPHSDFALLYEYDFKNLFLGCSPQDSGTFLIHIESLAPVPYREWVKLRRKTLDTAGNVQTVEIDYCSRKESLNNRTTGNDTRVKVNLAIYENLLLDQGILKSTSLNYGMAYAASIREMQDFLLEKIQQTPLLALKE